MIWPSTADSRLTGLMRTGFALVITLCGLGVANTTRALTVAPPSFEELVDRAGQIMRIEVTGVESRADETNGRRVIHTYVTARVLRALKGESQDVVTLRLFGGRVGNRRVQVPEMPEFSVGGRYIVFVKDNGSAFCPLVAANYGNYSLLTDRDGVERVLRSNGQPLTAEGDVVRAMAPSIGKQQPLAVQAAVTREQFETNILNQLRHARSR